jgi:uncharacterized protein
VPSSSHDPEPRDGLSLAQARSIALAAQRLAGADAGGGVDAMLRALGAVQLDTISVLARSHELVAYARLGRVAREHIEDVYWGPRAHAFEYYAHGNCILPIESWPYFAFRRRAWRARRPRASDQVMRAMRARLRRGPVTATDVGGARAGAGGWWNWSEQKIALELLYRRGEAVVTSRRGWRRIYDLPERAIPAKYAADRSDEDCYRYLAGLAARALGIGTARDIADYFHITKGVLGAAPDAKRLFAAVLAESGLVPVHVEGWDEVAYADPDALAAACPMKRRPTLLSPFDSLIWQRERTHRMFEFKFSLEAYKPKHLREHGYFTMPLLADGRLLGRVDPTRHGTTLVARTVTLEDRSALAAAASALRDAAAWVGCNAVKVERVRPRALTSALRKSVAGLT